MISYLARRGDTGDCSAVERVDCRDNDGEVDVQLRVGILTGELHRSLVGLRARVAEECLLYKSHACKGNTFMGRL
jgi:hypothetical protein